MTCVCVSYQDMSNLLTCLSFDKNQRGYKKPVQFRKKWNIEMAAIFLDLKTYIFRLSRSVMVDRSSPYIVFTTRLS